MMSHDILPSNLQLVVEYHGTRVHEYRTMVLEYSYRDPVSIKKNKSMLVQYPGIPGIKENDTRCP